MPEFVIHKITPEGKLGEVVEEVVKDGLFVKSKLRSYEPGGGSVVCRGHENPAQKDRGVTNTAATSQIASGEQRKRLGGESKMSTEERLILDRPTGATGLGRSFNGVW